MLPVRVGDWVKMVPSFLENCEIAFQSDRYVKLLRDCQESIALYGDLFYVVTVYKFRIRINVPLKKNLLGMTTGRTLVVRRIDIERVYDEYDKVLHDAGVLE